jgi:AbrB family looped-hinge helix DNA binding protein
MGMPVTIKGQVTIPKAIRDRLGITPGDSAVDFDVLPDGQVVLRRAGPPLLPSARLARFQGKPPPGWNGMTTEEIMRLTRGEHWGNDQIDPD